MVNLNERKQNVIEIAQKLFIEKGFQATSIQEILDTSGISKGTFYNYFSSKNELLIALFNTHYKKLVRNMNDLLIGQDPSNIDIFIKQIEYHMEMNKAYKLGALYEEVFVTNDAELKQFLKEGHLRILRWIYERFLDIFGKEKKDCLLDCAIMFMGILNQNYKFYSTEHSPDTSIHKVVIYSVNRITKLVNEVYESGDVLVNPGFLDRWLPDGKNSNLLLKKELFNTIFTIRKQVPANQDQTKYIELLDFIQNELLHARRPRKFLIESALMSLRIEPDLLNKKEIQKLEQLVGNYFEWSNEDIN